jgi:biopolymer transport protein ExbD
MPRRSVTRFVVPLIDVLILLFCIFLLMEFNSESKVDEQAEVVEGQSASIENLQALLIGRTKELSQFEEDRDKLQDFAKMREELERLRNITQKELKDRLYVRTLDVDSEDGGLSFYDETDAKQPIIKISNKKSAKALIDRHTKEAEVRGRTLYYQFVPPRPNEGFFPTREQKKNYINWFESIPNSYAGSNK